MSNHDSKRWLSSTPEYKIMSEYLDKLADKFSEMQTGDEDGRTNKDPDHSEAEERKGSQL